jgi:excisionase family DNA binding protein
MSKNAPNAMQRADELGRNSRLLKPGEVAERLAVPVSWIYGRSHLNNLPFPVVRVGSYLRFRESDIEKFMQSAGAPA